MGYVFSHPRTPAPPNYPRTPALGTILVPRTSYLVPRTSHLAPRLVFKVTPVRKIANKFAFTLT